MNKTSLRWPVAILDIGSNSIRLAVYDRVNPKKAIFNEKVFCALGRDLDRTGRLNPHAKKCARHAIAGFMHLARALGCGSTHAIATAAIRDASDGHAFVHSLRRDLKVSIQIISGRQEAQYSALGVLSTTDDAEGMVADLGGGSLELARIASGRVHETITLPLGTLRMLEHRRWLPQWMDGQLASISDRRCAGLPLYAVGGSGRAIATLDNQMKKKNRKVKNYCMTIPDLLAFRKKVQKMRPEKIGREFDIDLTRAQALPDTCLLFAHLMIKLNSSKLVITTRGLRDGYLFSLIKQHKV